MKDVVRPYLVAGFLPSATALGLAFWPFFRAIVVPMLWHLAQTGIRSSGSRRSGLIRKKEAVYLTVARPGDEEDSEQQ